jgi:hypothetical protein
LLLCLAQIGSYARADRRGYLAENLDRPTDVMLALQDVQQSLLRVLPGQPTDTLGQGWRGVIGDNAQAHFQRSKAALGVLAGLL